MVNTFSVGPVSLASKHKPLYSHIVTKNSHIDQCITAQKEKRNFMLPYYQRMSHVICKVGYPSFNARVSEHRMLSFQCNALFDEECKAHLKLLKLAKDKNEKALTLY